jgi:Helicase associated domain
MFEQLKAYRNEHGDCKVPQKKGKLGGWTDRQRKRYRATMQAREFWSHPENQGGKAPSLRHNTEMTDEQIEALNSIGFVWSLRERTTKNNSLGGGSDNDGLVHHHGYHPIASGHHSQGSVGGGVLMNAPEDEAATRSLLYFQGGRALADSTTHGFAAAGNGGGMMQSQQHQQPALYNEYIHPSYPIANHQEFNHANNNIHGVETMNHQGGYHHEAGVPSGYPNAQINQPFDGQYHHI